MFKQFCLNFIALIVACNISYADVVPRFIIEDIAHEINEADYIKLDKNQKESVINEIKNTNALEFDQLQKILLFHFNDIVADYLSEPIEYKITLGHLNRTQHLVPENISATNGHSIHDLESYIDNRVGHGTFKVVANNSIDVVVVGGFSKNLKQYLNQIIENQTVKVIKIPSIYEAWGISKYLVPAQNTLKKSTILWIVPPAMRYVRHYLTAFDVFSKNKPIGFVDNLAVKEYQKLVKSNSEIILANNKVDYLAFGYEKVWLSEISKMKNLKILQIQAETNLNLGVSFKVIKIFDELLKQEVSIGLIASDLTVWGELAAIQVKQFLNPNLKGVLFLGSAGSVDKKINVYDLSVPESFYRPGKKVDIKNFLSNMDFSDLSIKVHAHSRHGNTFSPIEQNVSYLKSVVKKGIGTVDVEQSLIAEAIDDYNRKNQTEIKFGAVNIVTDKPYAVISNEVVENSLDYLNYDLKQKAREKAVAITLKGIFGTSTEVRSKMCRSLF